MVEPLDVSPSDAARLISVSRRTINRLIEAGKIIARKTGSGKTARVLVDLASLHAYRNSLSVIGRVAAPQVPHA
jgi:excisionase family DNA binding protein